MAKESRTPLKKPRIIFLDIDGVLQPNWSQKRFGHDLEALRENLAERFGAGVPGDEPVRSGSGGP